MHLNVALITARTGRKQCCYVQHVRRACLGAGRQPFLELFVVSHTAAACHTEWLLHGFLQVLRDLRVG